MCICAFAYGYTSVFVQSEIQRSPTPIIFFYCSLLYFLRQVLSLSVELARWLALGPLGITCVCPSFGPPGAEVTRSALTWNPNSGPHACLHSKHFTH